jgi:ABC-2 type transport system ATP-binding protein
MLSDPEVLFLDEPTRSLDPVIAKSLRDFIKRNIAEGQGKTVFLSTHNLGEAEELCDRLAIIDRGKIKACGTLDEMKGILDGKRRYLIELEKPGEGLVKGLRLCREEGLPSRWLSMTNGLYPESSRSS